MCTTAVHSEMMRRKKICVVITDKAQLSRLLPLLFELKKSAHFKLQIIIGGGALTYRFGNVLDELRDHGFRPNVAIPTVIDGGAHGDHLAMAKTAALGMLEFATAFDNLDPDMIVVRGDRFEILPIATAAAYLNKILVHIEGGDVTGSIDESARHAVTKLAHVHFVTNRQSYDNVIRLGESKQSVFNVGSLDVDFLRRLKFVKKLDSRIVNDHGVGATLDLSQTFVVVMQNPVTTEAREARRQVTETLTAIHTMGVQAVWIWPNLDAGSDAISKKMREWQIRYNGRHAVRFIRYLGPEDFINVLNQSAVVVGNSSTGIKESSWLGIPAVNIGSRQQGRLRAKNVIDVGYDTKEITSALADQLKKGRYARSTIYGDGSAARTIVTILRSFKPSLQKKLTY